MPDLNDRKTDELFQVGAERHGFEYNPAAWKQMETLLDADASLTRWKWAVGAGISVVMLAIAAWFFFPITATDVTATSDSVNTSSPQPAEPAQDEVRQTITNRIAEAPTTQAAINQSIPSTDAVGAATRLTSPGDARPYTSVNKGGNSTKALAAGAAAGAKNGLAKATSKLTTSSPVTGENLVDTTQEELEMGKQGGELRSSAAPFVPSADLVGVSPLDIDLSSHLIITTENESEADFEKSPAGSGLALIASGGFILGQAGSDPFDDRRPRLGLELEYRLGKKFALSSGAFYNEVCYRTEEKNFSTKDEFWGPNGGLRPNDIQGECQVLEVPLSVKYYLNGSANNSFYVATGATTYLLLKEEYQVFYDDPDFQPTKSAWDVVGENQHYLGMGHFNLGYQRQLRGRSALKVEAFVQAPFTGIGEGSVRLLTTGLSLNYQFDFRKR